jgi:Protein of unknown function (DUF3592)
MGTENNGAAWIVGLIPTLVGMMFLGFAGSDFYKQYTIQHWPSADAVVTSSAISSTYGPSGRHNAMSETYWLNLEFRYAANGREYVTSRSIGDSSRLATEKDEAIYALGTHHSIHYDPADPRKIRMELGYDLFVPILCGMLALAAFGGGVFVIRAVLATSPSPLTISPKNG